MIALLALSAARPASTLDPIMMCDWRRRSSTSRRLEAARKAEAARAVAEGDTLLPAEAAAIAQASGPKAATYGEITASGFASLATRMDFGPATRFADLGSGTGKCVLQAVERNEVACACGVELAASRHAVGMKTLGGSAPAVRERVRLVQGDIADSALWASGGPLSEITDVFLSSLLFGDMLMERLQGHLEASPSVQQVATLKRFSGGLAGFKEDEQPEPCEMSWTMNLIADEAEREWALQQQRQDVYLYRRPR